MNEYPGGKPRATVFKHDETVETVAFSPDGKTLATGGNIAGNDKTVSVWGVQTGKKKVALKGHKIGVNGLSFSPDGRFLASGGEERVILSEVAGGRELANWEAHATKPEERTSVQAVVFFPDGKRLATGGFGWDNSVKIWDVSPVLPSK